MVSEFVLDCSLVVWLGFRERGEKKKMWNDQEKRALIDENVSDAERVTPIEIL